MSFFSLSWGAFFGSTRAASILPSRPPSLAAAARRACQGWPRLRGHPPGLALYGELEVKHLFNAFSTSFFLHSSFFVRLGIPFLRPDPHIVEAGARRGCQGRPSLWPGGPPRGSRPCLDSPEHGGTLVVVGMTHA